eukprot:NODE_848_length_3547_cov_0.613399.p1 type:complete len:766 gc:universal NODE_848_length_3547_cov_0.613399:3248-951(-)
MGDLNVISGDKFHTVIQFKSVKLIHIYRKKIPHFQNFFKEYIEPHLCENCIFVGDFNINLKKTLTTNESDFLTQMASIDLKFEEVDAPFSFINSRGHQSFCDFGFYKSNGKFNIIDSYFTQTNFSDHLMLNYEIDLNDKSDVIIHGKCPRWRINKLKDDENIQIKYQNELNIFMVRHSQMLYQMLFEFQTKEDSEKQPIIDELFDLINNALIKAGNCSFGKTMRHKKLFMSSFYESAYQRRDGNHQLANKIISRAKCLSLKSFRDKINSLSTCGFLKRMKSNRRRKSRIHQHLDVFAIEQHLQKWQSKWNLSTTINNPALPSDLSKSWSNISLEKLNDHLQNVHDFKNDKSIPDECKSLKKYLKNLPNDKSSGKDQIMNEFLKFAPDRFKSFICAFYNSICFAGIYPSQFNQNIIVPVHKGRNRKFNDIMSYRPICLASIFKKSLESIIKVIVMPELKTSSNQFGFKVGFSTTHAAYALENRINYLNSKGRTFKLVQCDVAAAFDSIDHSAFLILVQNMTLSTNIKCILINLVTKQNLQLRIGESFSKPQSVNKGILQGTMLSPQLFIKMIDETMKSIKLKLFTIWYADDLLLILEDNMPIEKALDAIGDCLADIGLHLNQSKTVVIDEKYSTWLGFQINQYGMNLKTQIQFNIKKCNRQLQQLAKVGVFQNNFCPEHLCKSIGSFLLPLIDIGMRIFEPEDGEVSKIDLFFNNAIRTLMKIPNSYPIDDMHILFNYKPYIHRWRDIISRFNNQLSFKTNSLHLI